MPLRAIAPLAVCALLSACERETKPAAARASASAASAARAPALDKEPSAAAPKLRRRDISPWLGRAERVALGDLDGDGTEEIVAADAGRLWVADAAGRELASRPTPGGVQVLEVRDLDGDGASEVLAGFGETVSRRGATATVAIYRLRAGSLEEEIVVAPQTTRNEIVAVLPLPLNHPLVATKGGGSGAGALLLAYFEEKFLVRLATAVRSGKTWQLSSLGSAPMATSVTLGDTDGDGVKEVIVGRVYGDQPKSHGDAFVLEVDGTRTAIPTTRGVRGLLAVDLDGDGKDEVLLGDGWHFNYGKLARAQLTVARREGKVFRSQTVANFDGQYTLWQILAADLDGDGKPEVAVRGSGHIAWLFPARGWAKHSIFGVAPDFAVGATSEFWILGSRAEHITAERR